MQIWDSSTTTSGAASVEACRVQCQEDTACNYYTFDGADGACSLSASNANQVSVANNLISSGDKYCGLEASLAKDCYEIDVVMWTSHTSLPDTHSLESCQQHCSSSQTCFYFNWGKDMKECRLFTAADARQISGGWTLGQRVCRDRCISWDTGFTDNGQAEFAVFHYGGCRQLCQASATCEAFYHNVNQNVCHMMTNTIAEAGARAG